MQIFQTATFIRTGKKLHKNEKKDLDAAIKEIAENPVIGEQKKGDLKSIRVHKFSMVNQQALLAYLYDEDIPAITLVSLGSHENFYRDLKRNSAYGD